MNLPKYRFYKSAWAWYALALIIVVFDQLTKFWVSKNFYYDEISEITSFFHFTLRHNYGAAFSLFHDGSGWQRWFLGGLSTVVSLVLVVWIGSLEKSRRFEAIALGLVLGGAVGNLIDRVFMGYVVDFIVFHYEQHAFPAFNIADSAISVGAGLLIFDAVFHKRDHAQEAKS